MKYLDELKDFVSNKIDYANANPTKAKLIGGLILVTIILIII